MALMKDLDHSRRSKTWPLIKGELGQLRGQEREKNSEQETREKEERRKKERQESLFSSWKILVLQDFQISKVS